MTFFLAKLVGVFSIIGCNCTIITDKSGCELEQALIVVKHVMQNCKNLKFKGFMTIGAYGYDPSNGPNLDFISLIKCREDVCKGLSLSKDDIELSMGMSTDFEHAVSNLKKKPCNIRKKKVLSYDKKNITLLSS